MPKGEKTKLLWTNPKFRDRMLRSFAVARKPRKSKKVKLACIECGKINDVWPYRVAGFKYCNRVCQGRANGARLGKSNKGRKMPESMRQKTSLRMKGKQYCLGKLSPFRGKKRENIQGKNHWNWKGGISTETNKIRTGLEYKTWRREVYKHDWFTCVSCGFNGEQIAAHHVVPFRESSSLRLEVNNGITLCNPCHEATRNVELAYLPVFFGLIASR